MKLGNEVNTDITIQYNNVYYNYGIESVTRDIWDALYFTVSINIGSTVTESFRNKFFN